MTSVTDAPDDHSGIAAIGPATCWPRLAPPRRRRRRCGATSTATPSSASTCPGPRQAVLEALDGLPPRRSRTGHDDVVGRRRPRRRPSPVRRSCCAATWTRCRCPRTPASTSRPRSTAPCTPAVTTPTWRCSSAPPACSRPAGATSPGASAFMFQPGEEGHDGAASCSTRACSTRPTAASPGAFAIHQSPTIPSGLVATKGGPLLASADDFQITVTRPRRPRVDAAPRQRPDPGRVRDRAGAPDDGHAPGRRLRPRRSSRWPGSGPARRTTSSPRPPSSLGTIRTVVRAGARPRCTTTSAASPSTSPRPTTRRPTSTSSRGYPVTVNDDGAADDVLDTAPPAARRRPRRRHAVAGDGRRGLLVRDSSRCRARWRSSAPGPRACGPPTSRRTTRTAWCSTRSAMTTGVALYAAVALRRLAG